MQMMQALHKNTKRLLTQKIVCQLLRYTELENNHDCTTNCYRGTRTQTIALRGTTA